MHKTFTAMALALVCTLAAAQPGLKAADKLATAPQRGTSGVAFSRSDNGGRPVVCTLDFSAVDRDAAAPRSALFKATGSFSMLRSDKGPAFALRLGLFDATNPNGPGMAPAEAFLGSLQGKAQVRPKARMDDDTPGYALYLFPFDDSLVDVWKDMVQEHQLKIGFNRAPRQRVATVVVDLEAETGGKSVTAVGEMSGCVDELLAAAREQLPR